MELALWILGSMTVAGLTLFYTIRQLSPAWVKTDTDLETLPYLQNIRDDLADQREWNR